MTRNLLFLMLALSMTACVVDEADLSKYMSAKVENLEEAHDINVMYTDSSYLIFNLKAPRMRRVYTKFSVTEEFPDGIQVTFLIKQVIRELAES